MGRESESGVHKKKNRMIREREGQRNDSDVEIRMCSTLICTQNTVKTTRSKEIWGGEDKQIDSQGQLYEQNTSEIKVTDVNRSLRQEKDNKIDSQTRLHAFLFDQSCLILIWERASFNFCTTFSTIKLAADWLLSFSDLIGSLLLPANWHFAHLETELMEIGFAIFMVPHDAWRWIAQARNGSF